jgi:anhydro-N-acetylmuramic acid kinase
LKIVIWLIRKTAHRHNNAGRVAEQPEQSSFPIHAAWSIRSGSGINRGEDMRAIGLMSGTSLDGIDVALIETDGEEVTRFGPHATNAYRADEKAMLRRALENGRSLDDRAARPGVLGQAERMITARHAEAVETFLAVNKIDRSSVDVIGFHGQTVLHRPQTGLTVQIGDGAALADRLGLPIVYDFRAADVAAGGQGAPLVPVFHRAIAATLDRPRPLMVLNLGGVANITFLTETADPIAGDTGPGNALIDDFMQARNGEAYDDGGATAARGRVDQGFVDHVLAHPFFAAPLPKSLDRNAFAFVSQGRSDRVLGHGMLGDMTLADGAASLTALTAAAVARVVPHLPQPPASVIVAGGGARNRTMMAMLAERLAPATVETASAATWSADALEAQAFAYLAVRSLRGLPITFPGTTGAPRPLPGGIIAMPAPARRAMR